MQKRPYFFWPKTERESRKTFFKKGHKTEWFSYRPSLIWKTLFFWRTLGCTESGFWAQRSFHAECSLQGFYLWSRAVSVCVCRTGCMRAHVCTCVYVCVCVFMCPSQHAHYNHNTQNQKHVFYYCVLSTWERLGLRANTHTRTHAHSHTKWLPVRS